MKPRHTSRQQKEAQRLELVLEGLKHHYPDANCALQHRNPYELLAATILSAQCTDARVNLVTPRLFERYPDSHALAAAEMEELQEIIRSTGFFRNKAKSLKGFATQVVESHGGEIPSSMTELLALPGVARKTANVVLGTAFGIADGVVVDTHVSRLSQRLGYTAEKTPVKIERDLMEQLPREEWIQFSHRLILHGRQLCKSQRPRCEACFMADLCPFGLEQLG